MGMQDAARMAVAVAVVGRECLGQGTRFRGRLTAATDLAGLTRGRTHVVRPPAPPEAPPEPPLPSASLPLTSPPLSPSLHEQANEGAPSPSPSPRRRLRERRVPSSPLERVAGFASLGAGLAWGTMQESMRRMWIGQDERASSPFLSDRNAERLALGLCRMRGAALKLGQMLSIQDESLVPAPILAALEMVRQGADVMPKKQLHRVLAAELGPDWRDRLLEFDEEPMAAASIGQVHRATLKGGELAVMKIQYPGVAESIDSDIDNAKRLLDYTNLIPKGLYLDQAIKVAKLELAKECDYELEASNQKRFKDLVAEYKDFYVPAVYGDLCSKRVLTTQLVYGVSIDKVATMPQRTDPNWSNFLYDANSDTINLIDFGAARDYPKQFIDDYLRMVMACANKDREKVVDMSIRLGFLTGMESEVMLDAHVEAAFVVGMPFAKSGGYDFGKTDLTARVSDLGATMLRHRLKPPPDEAYSLHRKLSGAFLACIKLKSVVNCREMLVRAYDEHTFDH